MDVQDIHVLLESKVTVVSAEMIISPARLFTNSLNTGLCPLSISSTLVQLFVPLSLLLHSIFYDLKNVLFFF